MKFLLVVFACTLCLAQDAKEKARTLRRQGDDELLRRQWSAAIDALSEAIRLEPDNFLGYMKRAQAYQGAGQLEQAISDLSATLERKSDHVKSKVKRGELLQQVGRYQESADSVADISSTDADASRIQRVSSFLAQLQRSLDQLRSNKDWTGALAVLTEMEGVGASKDLLAMDRCQLRFESGQYYEAAADAMSLLKKDQSNTKALFIRARSFFEIGELDAALNHLKQCIRVDPDHAKCGEELKKIHHMIDKRDVATTFVKNQQWAQAVAPLKEAMEVFKASPVYLRDLHASLCEAYEKSATTIELWKEGVTACTAALDAGVAQDQIKLLRGNLHQKLGNWGEAIADFSAVLQAQPNNMHIRQKIQEVQNAKKMAERKDYYKILDVPRDAHPKQIKSAFRKLALQWHPDKFENEGDREKANKMFQDLNEAYDVLTTEEKKARYDRGEDVEGQPQQQQWQGFNPFGGGGGFQQQFTFRFN